MIKYCKTWTNNMQTHKRIDKIKTEQGIKLETLKSSKMRNQLIFLGIPLLGIAALFVLSMTGVLKFQYHLFFQRIIYIVGPLICVISMFFMLLLRFNSNKPKKLFVKTIIWLGFFTFFTLFLILVIPDSVLIQIQEYFIHFR